MESPLVTVICLCYNQKNYVIESLESVLNQTYKSIQLIVVDDASTDGSKEVINEFIKDKPFIDFINLKYNVGNCKAFNIALQKAKGEYIIDLAADDALLPQRITVGLKAFGKDLFIGVHFSDAELIDIHGKHLSYHSSNLVNAFVPQGDIYEAAIKSYFVCSPTMMFRKSVADRLNGYDESLSYEDFDFIIRVSRITNFGYSDEVLVRKRIIENSLSARQFSLRSTHQYSTYKVCEKIFTLNKNRKEQQALSKRLLYEIKTNLKLFNVGLAKKYFMLWRKNKSFTYGYPHS